MSRLHFKPAALAAASVLAVAVCAAPALAAPLARVEASSASPGPRVARSFLGFSQEFQNVEATIGPRGAPLNPAFLALVGRLAAYGGGTPMLRIGGGSTDLSFLADQTHSRPHGMVHAIDPGFLENVARYLQATHAPLIFGINFGLFRPGLAAAMASAVMHAMPAGSVSGLELGNEPDTYQHFDLYPGRRIRSGGWGPAAYTTQVLRYDRAILGADPRAPIAGPSLIGGYLPWLQAFPTIVARQRHVPGLVTVHQYPLLSCGRRAGTHRYVSPWELLGHPAVDGRAALLSSLASIAGRYGKRLRVTEANSVACGGSPGASDAFASALWGADWSFMVAAVNGSGVDFHMASANYAPLSVGYTAAGAAALVHPLYYGMLFFAQATAHRARLLSDSYKQLRVRKGINLHAWATYDHVDRVVRVAIIDKDRRGRGTVVVHVPGARGPGRLSRLAAPSVSSKQVTLGGQRFAVPTTGDLIGRPRVADVPRRSGSRFRVSMSGPGAALLTVPVGRLR